jgi:hypothetical protein
VHQGALVCRHTTEVQAMHVVGPQESPVECGLLIDCKSVDFSIRQCVPYAATKPETVDHLLMQCSFSREVWHKCLLSYRMQSLTPDTTTILADWWPATSVAAGAADRRDQSGGSRQVCHNAIRGMQKDLHGDGAMDNC